MYLKAYPYDQVFFGKTILASYGFRENMFAIIPLQCLTAICLHPGGWKE